MHSNDTVPTEGLKKHWSITSEPKQTKEKDRYYSNYITNSYIYVYIYIYIYFFFFFKNAYFCCPEMRVSITKPAKATSFKALMCTVHPP